MSQHPKMSSLLKSKSIYISRNRIAHQVKEGRLVGNMIYLTLDCGICVTVKDSKRSRGTRWLKNMVYWTECKRCSFTTKPSAKHPPREKLKVAPEKKYSRRELRLGNFDVRTITHG